MPVKLRYKGKLNYTQPKKVNVFLFSQDHSTKKKKKNGVTTWVAGIAALEPNSQR